MKAPQVAYVTCRIDPADPDVDYDMGLFIGALLNRGIDATAVVWDDPGIDWGRYDLALIRSTWDYSHQRERFLALAKSIASVTRLENPYDVIEENTDKRYLRTFAERGIPVISSLFLNGPSDLEKRFQDASAGWVVKPAVGAGARGAGRYDTWHGVEEAVQAHFRKNDVPLILQPYMEEVERSGEIAVMCCRGVPTHAVVKKPALSEGGHGDFGAKAGITPGLETFVRKVLSHRSPQGTYADLLYSRVDVVPTKAGFLLMELEVTEPFLFLSYHESAVEIFADAVAAMF